MRKVTTLSSIAKASLNEVVKPALPSASGAAFARDELPTAPAADTATAD
ncbi:hypothetical protein RISK_003049 [Rhodopirellula islandica]|uniref:Uncharacterized protein n=1 Tax=Rhodopirellula islandica TaxID=595434 RepID=A0A0J1BE33_RHOIS|nr:hypothetical protein RISK_003049 [Rhodopirellula islandica]